MLLGQSDGNSLQQHYDQAQKFQQQGQMDAAAGQYRAFLAGALSELGMSYSLARDYKQADSYFSSALALEPDSPAALLDSARTAFLLHDLDRTKALASEVIQQHPGTQPQLAEAHQLLGRALMHQNQDRQARAELAAALKLDPTFANGYDLAVACLDLDDGTCAAQIFSDMEKSLGDTAELHLAIARAYADSDFQPRALAEIKRAIQENPRLPGAHYLLAVTLLGGGGDQAHVDAAEAALRRELAISPRDAETYAALGKLEANHGHQAQAAQYLKRAIALDPQNPDPCLFLGQMYFTARNYVDAETYLRKSIQLTTDPSRNRYQIQRAHYLLGRILVQKGDREAAQKEMQISRELADKALTNDRSKLAALLDSPDSAKDAASAERSFAAGAVDAKALGAADALRARLKPAIADGYNNLGAIAATGDDYPAAATYFEQAATWNPSMPGIDYNLGRAAFAASRYADAIAPLTRYVKAHPSIAGARSVLGISEFMTGDYKGCIEALEPLAGESGLAPQLQYMYAESLVHTGQRAQGIARLEALEKAHPEIPDVRRALAEAQQQ